MTQVTMSTDTEMSFLPNGEQEELVTLTKAVLENISTDERIANIDAQPGTWDTEQYRTLIETGILEALIGDEDDPGMGMQGLILVAEQCGRYLARVPLVPTALAAQILQEADQHGEVEKVLNGDMTVAVAVPDALSTVSMDDGKLSGHCGYVFAGGMASHLLVLAPDGAAGLVAVDAPGVTVSTTGWGYTEDLAISFDTSISHVTVIDPLVTQHSRSRWNVAQAALITGACRSAIARTASYVSERHQFGTPLSTKQGVALRAADAHIDTEAIWLTTMNAAAAVDNPAEDPGQTARFAAEAAWWANTAGVRVVHATQHLHGGMGADTDSHIHRFFTFVRGLAIALGPADDLLDTLGKAIISLPKGGLS